VGIISILSEVARMPDIDAVVVFETFLLGDTSNFRVLELYHSLFGLKYIFVGQDETVIRIMSVLGDVHRVPYTSIDYGFIQTVVYGDVKNEQDTSISGLGAYLERTDFTEADKEYIQKVLDLCDSCVDYSTRLIGESKHLRMNNEALKKRTRIILDSVKEQVLSADRAEVIIKQFETSYVKDVYSEVEGTYTDKPFVLYLKEYQELVSMEFLLETLMSMFKMHLHLMPKVLRLGDSNSCRMLQRLPSYYHKIEDTFLQKEVLDNDFLVKTGNNTVLLNYILTNQEKLGVLIVLDCRDYFGKALSDNLIDQYFDVCRETHGIRAYNLDKYRCITNDLSTPLYWNVDEEKMMELSGVDRFMYLVNSDLVSKIYEIYKELNTVI
jgi:hypothetical protein